LTLHLLIAELLWQNGDVYRIFNQVNNNVMKKLLIELFWSSFFGLILASINIFDGSVFRIGKLFDALIFGKYYNDGRIEFLFGLMITFLVIQTVKYYKKMK
jgi:hypothetical protein